MIARVAPSPPGLPFVGHAWQLLQRPGDFLLESRQTHGPALLLRYGPVRSLTVSSPRAAREVLVDKADHFAKGYPEMKLALGEGILTADTERWRAPRKLMNPFFKADAVAGLTSCFSSLTDDMLHRWDACARSGRALDAHEEMTHLTFRCAGIALFGVDLKDESHALCDAATTLTRNLFEVSTRPVPMPSWLPTPLNRSLRRSVAAIDTVVDRVMGQRDDAGQAPPLTARMMHGADMCPPLNRQEMRDQIVTLLLAGHETTATALSWSLMLLARHPEEAEHLHATMTPEASAQDAADRARCILFEAMRLYPPAWMFERRALLDTEIDGYQVPKGSLVAVCPWLLHRDAEVWPEPTLFNPRRFLSDEARRRDKHAYVPFGGGMRQCIGMHFAMVEMQIILSMIVQRFRFRLAREARIEPEFTVTLRPRYGVPLVLEAR